MRKKIIFLVITSVLSTISFASQSSIVPNNVKSGSTIKSSSASSINYSLSHNVSYQGVDERSKLKMFRIAILPFSLKEGINISDNINQEKLQTVLNSSIVSQITQARKFRVSNRDANDEKVYETEIKRILDSKSDKDKNMLNQKIGADFIVTGDILSVNISKSKTSYYGEDFETLHVSAAVAYRVLELATMEVKWSNVVNFDVPTSIANQYVDDKGSNYVQLLSYLGNQLGKTISDQIIGAIYPIQVLKVDDGDIYFNQGGNRVVKGSVYEVRQEGGVTVDPATGQHIVTDSKVLAKVRITDVMPKYSIGIVIDGSLASVRPGLRAYLIK
ncbi:MAG: hypothetical protein Kow0076_5190 [Francisella sp.]